MKKVKKLSTVKKLGLGLAAMALMASLVGCESSERTMKNFQSEFGGGLKRDLIVYAENGDVIFKTEGKFDIDYSDGRLKYVDEMDKVHTIYLGNSATVISNEVGAE